MEQEEEEQAEELSSSKLGPGARGKEKNRNGRRKICRWKRKSKDRCMGRKKRAGGEEKEETGRGKEDE